MEIKYNKIIYEIKEHIGYLILNDPPANKTTGELLGELIQFVRSHLVNSSLKGLIITGSGRHYSSGADVEELKKIITDNSRMEENQLMSYPACYLENRTAYQFLESLDIPVISAVRGVCIGSGMELALCSHIRICAKGGTLGLPESTFGLLPGLTGTLRCLELMGLGTALELILSGRTLTSEEALGIGLADVIVSKKGLMSYCEGLMQYIISGGTYKKEQVKEYIRDYNRGYKTLNG